MTKKIMVRIMSPKGILRFELPETQTIGSVADMIAEKCNVSSSDFTLTQTPKSVSLDSAHTLSYSKVLNGDMLYCRMKPRDRSEETDFSKNALSSLSSIKGDTKTDIVTNPDILLDEDCGTDSSGDLAMHLRVGCTHPSNMQCFWCIPKRRYVPKERVCTCRKKRAVCVECFKYSNGLVPRIVIQEKMKCKGIFMYKSVLSLFYDFAVEFAPWYSMIGLIYGHELPSEIMDGPEKTILGEFVYEPPLIHLQDDKGGNTDCVRLDDSPAAVQQREEADALLNIFGLRCIGWVYTHFTQTVLNEVTHKEEEKSLPTAEKVIMAGRLQALHGHRFCTISISLPKVGPADAAQWLQTVEDYRNGGKVPTKMSCWQTSLQFQRLLRRGTIASVQNHEDKSMIQTTEPVRWYGIEETKHFFPAGLAVAPDGKNGIPYGDVPRGSKPPMFRQQILPRRPCCGGSSGSGSTSRSSSSSSGSSSSGSGGGESANKERVKMASNIIASREPFLIQMNDPNMLLYLLHERGVAADVVFDIARAIVAQGDPNADDMDTTDMEAVVRAAVGL